MKVEYDFVAIGATPEGIFAALNAALLNARVALVEQGCESGLNGFETIYSQTFSHAAHLFRRWQTQTFGIDPAIASSTSEIKLTEIQSRAGEIIDTIAEQNSLAILAANGVDVVSGAGEFCRRPDRAFLVKKRRLRSRAYLIATGSTPTVPDLEELQKIGYLNFKELWQQDKLESLPQCLAIAGGSSFGVELAQSLKRLGKEIFLIVESSQILPEEDSEASQLIRAHLEADGVKILTSSPITQVKRIENKKWLQAGDRAIAVDEIIWAGKPVPNTEGLNLESVGVKFGKWGIRLNEKLQTTNHRIYACGEVGGEERSLHLARYEASIALKNALFLPWHRVDYSCIPRVIFTVPQLASLGMSEVRAREVYGQNVGVIKQYFKNIPRSQVLGETTGFCKLLVCPKGRILGARVVGAEAGETIGTLALVMKNRMTIEAIARSIFPSPTLSEIISQTALEWQRQRASRNKILNSLQKRWFECRRN